MQLWPLIHNAVAHPLMAVFPGEWTTWIHDETARRAWPTPMPKKKDLTVDDMLDRALTLREEDLDDDERAILAERLTEGGRYWTRIGVGLVREARQCRGSRSRKAKLELLKMARGAFKSAFDCDRPSEIVEIKKLTEELQKRERSSKDIEDLH